MWGPLFGASRVRVFARVTTTVASIGLVAIGGASAINGSAGGRAVSLRAQTGGQRIVIPTAAQIKFAIASKLNIQQRARLAAVYDKLRLALVEAHIDRHLILAILSTFADGNLQRQRSPDEMAAFELYGPEYSVSQRRCTRERLTQVLDQYSPIWLPKRDPRADIFIENDGPPTADDLISAAMASALARMVRIQKSLPDIAGQCSDRSSPDVLKPAKWFTPVRISSSGSAFLDSEIRRAINDLLAAVPELHVIHATFLAPPDEANLWVSSSTNDDVKSRLMECDQNKRCTTIRELFVATGAPTGPKAKASLVKTTDLSLPYIQSANGAAILRKSTSGAILEAGCTADALGFVGPESGGPSLRSPDAVFTCLGQALGATPDVTTDAAGQSIGTKAAVIIQLRKLYRKGK